ncbi:MAG: hypothetical protein RR869_08445 [Lachnospiraceae bacterium]
MNKARRRLRVCLICVVMVAIVIGIFYYYYHMNRETTMNEGMLVTKNMIPVWIWQ